MSDFSEFGPLIPLIGRWQGDGGLDVAPEPDGDSKTPYFETIDIEAVGDVENAESQQLWVLRYHQVVSRKADQCVFHDQVGYWMWDPQTQVIMQSLTIPRGLSLLAGGGVSHDGDKSTFKVSAALDNEQWQISQSPFMSNKAKTLAYDITLSVEGDSLEYSQDIILDIYGKHFRHSDNNTLTRV